MQAEAVTSVVPLSIDRVPRWSVHEEQLFAWYFSRGQTAFERSAFGAMLEHAEMFSTGHTGWARQPVYGRDGVRVIGWERALSARPTAELREPSGYMPDIDTLRKFAHVSIQLMRVERACRMSAHVIELIHGDAGAHWATSDAGRLGALYHLTAKGRVMAADSRKRSPTDLTDSQRMAVLVQLDSTQSKPERKAALAVCAKQASALEYTARAHWFFAKSRAAVAA